MVAAPRRPLDDALHGEPLPGGLFERRSEPHDVERPGDGDARMWRDEALEEEVPELEVVTVELTVRGDHGQWRRAVREGGIGQPRRHVLTREGVGVRRRGRVEGDGAR